MKVNQLIKENIEHNLKGLIDYDTLLNKKFLTGIVNVDGNVNLYERNIQILPVKFGTVTGYFRCGDNSLLSFKNSPRSIGGFFGCSGNQIDSFEGAPSIIGGDFDIYSNKFTSLTGINKHIKKIDGSISCYKNPITSGGLGLLLIEGLRYVNAVKETGTFGTAMEIIDKYLLKGSSNIKGIKALYLCEDELIQAGLEAYAQV